MNLQFNHPLIELWANNPSYLKSYMDFKKARFDGKYFKWYWRTSERPEAGTVSKSEFLTRLNNDLTEVNSENLSYLCLPRPVMEYKLYEDDFVRTAITYLINHDDVDVHHYITNDLGLEPGFDYLLLNYLENSDYMDHIMDIRIKNESQ